MKGQFHREGFSPDVSKLTHPGLASVTWTVTLSSQPGQAGDYRLFIIQAGSTPVAMAGCPLLCDDVIFPGMANLAEVPSADGSTKVHSVPSTEFQTCAWQILSFAGNGLKS